MSELYHLYFAACADDGGVYHYTFRDGALKFVKKTDVHRPMYLYATDRDMEIVLQCPFADHRRSGLVRYALSDYELENPSDVIDTKGTEGCHLCRFEGNTYVVNYMSGNIFSTSGKVDTHEGVGPNPMRQEMPHTHFVNVSPDGKYLLSVDLGLDSIYTYDKDLNVVSIAKTPAGYGPRHLAYTEDGRRVYCINELDYSISIFDYADGVLTYVDSVKTLDHEVPGNTAAAIRVSGNWVYVSNRTDDSISALYDDGHTLTLKNTVKCNGVSPRDFLLVDGYLFCTNERTDNVTIFTVTEDRIQKIPTELHMKNPLCVVAVK